jgi:hypothetical protein
MVFFSLFFYALKNPKAFENGFSTFAVAYILSFYCTSSFSDLPVNVFFKGCTGVGILIIGTIGLIKGNTSLELD